jgi:hypothetical protein
MSVMCHLPQERERRLEAISRRRKLGPPVQSRFQIIAQLPHVLAGLANIRFAESDAHLRGDHQKPGIQLAVARIAFPRQLHQLRAPVLWIVDEFDESFGG